MSKYSKILLAGILSAFVGSAAVAETTTLRLASTLPLTHHVSQAEEMFTKLVAEKSNQRITVEYYPSGQLYPASAIQNAVATGALEIGANLIALWTNSAIGEIADIPFFLEGYEHTNKVYSADGKVFSVLEETLAQSGMRPLFFMNFGSFFDIANNKQQLVHVDDFKGMQIRSYGAMGAQALRALGAAPVVMDPGEMYMGLQRGTIDGVISGISSFHHRNLWEVTKYITMTGASMGVMAVVMNKAAFDNLSQEDRDAITEAAAETQKWSFAESERQDQASLEFIRKAGLSIHELSADERNELRGLMASVLDSWRERASEEEIKALEWAGSIR